MDEATVYMNGCVPYCALSMVMIEFIRRNLSDFKDAHLVNVTKVVPLHTTKVSSSK